MDDPYSMSKYLNLSSALYVLKMRSARLNLFKALKDTSGYKSHFPLFEYSTDSFIFQAKLPALLLRFVLT
ncbi:hypothetical protein AMD27_10155 [Acinetobacter sp. TGL-Y2]|nr:hypothetical protein AMD27_10155 [Acinetobacter sp. TGL-Y2]